VKAYHPLGNRDRSRFTIVEAVGFTLTGMVLLVVCLNIYGMMQVRSAMRERELSIRQAIGASRARLMRYLLTEAVILAGLGGALASLVLFNIPSLLSWFAGRPLPMQIDEALTLDLPMIAICIGICLLTSVLFGLLPAARFSRPTLLSSMKDDAGGGGMRVGRAHRVTAALQIAIAVPLIVMSFMSLDRMRATAMADLGFASETLLAAPLNLDGVENREFRVRSAVAELAQAPGVAAVTVADGLPLDFRYRETKVAREVGPDMAPTFAFAQVTRVADDFLKTMAIPVVRGRDFTADDRAGSAAVTIISTPLADKLFPNAEAIGQRLLYGADLATQKVLTVIGVTGDFPTSQMSTEREQLLLPLAQYADIARDSYAVRDEVGNRPFVMLVARQATGADPRAVSAVLATIAREFDPDFDAASIVTGVGLRKKSMNDFMTQSAVAGGAGSVILMLSALGIYGVVGLMVATRTREIAVRAALGASRTRVIGMVLFDVVKLAMPGIAVGTVLTMVLNHINSENMGIALSGVEPLSYVAGAAVAILVAVVASLAPARRAASVAPMMAMRSL
jgi:predicted permease